MEIVSNREEIIFKNGRDDKVYYSIGVSKKKQDNTYESGYVPIRFKKDVQLENKTKIKIKNAWLDFYVKDKKTYPYIFVSDFEIAQQPQAENLGNNTEQNPFEDFGNSIKTEVSTEEQIQITDEDLPF